MKFSMVIRFKNPDFKMLLLIQPRSGVVGVVSVKALFIHRFGNYTPFLRLKTLAEL